MYKANLRNYFRLFQEFLEDGRNDVAYRLNMYVKVEHLGLLLRFDEDYGDGDFRDGSYFDVTWECSTIIVSRDDVTNWTE